MIPAKFDYVVAKDLQDAVQLLSKHGPDAKVLSGGHSLIPLMKMRLAAPTVLVDMGRIPELHFVHEEGEEIVIGAMTTYHQIEVSPVILEKAPLLAETAALVGDVQVRNRGTIGGSLVHADPAADLPAAILALDAKMKIVGAGGMREVPAGEFFVDMLQTAVQPGEVLAEIRIARAKPGQGSAYRKVAQSASGFALVGVAAVVALNAKTCSDIRLGVSGVGAKPYRATEVESALRGGKLDKARVQQACAQIARDVDVLSDIHASADYRKDLAAVYARRAIEEAAKRAGS